MGLASEMKNLSEGILASFKQRITENEELVNDVQKTLDGFRKDHQEMAAILNANAIALRKDLADGEKERLNTYHQLMTEIHNTIGTIQKEVVAIQTSTFEMINEYSADRTLMAEELNKFFADGRADRMENEKSRLQEFDALMKSINDDIKSINDDVLAIFKNTNEMLQKFENDHQDMSKELRAELGKNLADRVEFTRVLLNGFQKRLSEINKENQAMAQKLWKDLANGETDRLNDYKEIMNDIHASIKGIQNEVKAIQNATAGMIGDLTKDRGQANAEWAKMQAAMAQIRENGVVAPVKEEVKKVEKKEMKVAPVAEVPKKAHVKEEVAVVAKETKVEVPKEAEAKVEAPMALEQKVLNYISKHPQGVKISEMEEPLGETRMKLGFTTKILLDEGKVQKIDNVFFPLK